MRVDEATPADAEDQLSSPPAFHIIVLVSTAHDSTYKLSGSGLRRETNHFHVDIDNKLLHIANQPMSVSGVYLQLPCALVFAA